MNSTEILIKFQSEEQANLFMNWLDGSGEQDLFEYTWEADKDGKGDINRIEYDYQNNIINMSYE